MSNKNSDYAMRHNNGKIRYELIPTHLLESTARVFEYGATKYEPNNWAKPQPYTQVIGCLKRHLAAIERGEDIDQESNQRHIGHIICNALMLEHYMNLVQDSSVTGIDDRCQSWKNS